MGLFGKKLATSKGWYFGANLAAKARSEVKTFQAKEILADKAVKARLKEMHKVDKRMEYHVKQVEKLVGNKKLISNIDKFKSKLHPIVEDISKDINIFGAAFKGFLESVKTALFQGLQMEFYTASNLPELANKIWTEASKQKVVLDQTLIKNIREEIEMYKHTVDNDLDKQQKYTKKLAHNDLHVPMLVPAQWIAGKTKKLTKKVAKSGQQTILENINEIERQFKDGIKQDILIRFFNHVKNIEKFEELYNELLHDLKELMQIAERHLEKAGEHIKLFLSKFKFEEANRWNKELSKLKDFSKEMFEAEKKEYKLENELKEMIDKLCDQTEGIFNRITKASQSLTSQIKKTDTLDYLANYKKEVPKAPGS